MENRHAIVRRNYCTRKSSSTQHSPLDGDLDFGGGRRVANDLLDFGACEPRELHAVPLYYPVAYKRQKKFVNRCTREDREN